MAQGFFQGFRGNLAGQQAFGLRRVEPLNLHIQQRRRGYKHLMGISSGGNPRRFAPLQGILHRQKHHGTNGKRRPFCRIHRPAAAKKGSCIFFTFQDNPRGVVQHVRPGNLGDVQLLCRSPALVSRHMKPIRLAGCIVPDEITDGGVHSCSSALAASTMMAHSIRLRNSSQPYL